MKKGVAVPYIIAIILGIVVIGLIGYWLFKGSGNIGGTSTVTECNEKAVTYCGEWQIKSKGVFDSVNRPDSDDWTTTWKACNAIGVTTPDKNNCLLRMGISQ